MRQTEQNDKGKSSKQMKIKLLFL